ncbi:MAG: hypothetical protein EXS05_18535 [Planctomycetaceae bacterium]|nr:hypothetical protein [Planctomycetaceae bacterium]
MHRQRTRNRCQVPCYRYGADVPLRTATTRSLFAMPAETVQLNSSSKAVDTATRCKRFRLSESRIDNPPVSFGQVGLVVYETGEAAFTGTLTHDGGPLGDLKVNRVTIRVRAYGGTRTDLQDGDDNQAGPCLCEWSECYLVRRGEPAVVRLSGDQKTHDALRRFFNEIVQIELDVTVRNSR